MGRQRVRRPRQPVSVERSGWPQPLPTILQATQIIFTLLRILLDHH